AQDTPTQYMEDEESDPNLEIPNITDIINDVPPPIPSGKMIPLAKEEDWSTRPSISRPRDMSRESSPAVRVNDLLIANQNEQTVEHVVQDFDATMPSQSRPRPLTPIGRQTGELDETRPHSITEVAGRVMMEPISPGLYNLTYACLLVP